MNPDALAADNAPLTVDQAVAFLDAREKNDEAPAQADAASTEGPNTEAEPAAEAANEPETATDGENAETDDTEGEAEEAELPAIEPPRFWDADKKELFKALPRDAQEYVLAKETERDKATSKAMEEAANARNKAHGEASRIAQLTGVLDKLIPEVEARYSQWENVDWPEVARTRTAEQYNELRAEYEQIQQQRQRLQDAKVSADEVMLNRYMDEQRAKYQELVPDLCDATHGDERRQELGKFLVGEMTKADLKKEFQEQNLKTLPAWQASLAYDAMRYRKAEADAKAKAELPRKEPKPAATPKPTLKSTSAPARGGSPQHAEYAALAKMKTHTMDQATRFLDLKDQLNI